MRWLGRTIDRVIGELAPERALRRAQARLALSAVTRGYDAGTATRSLGRDDWGLGGVASADALLLGALPVMRERMRELNRNDAIAAAITRAFVDNIVGTGLTPQSSVDYEALGITEDDATAWADAVEAVFRRWVPEADCSDSADFYGLQALAVRKWIEDGESFIHPAMSRAKWRTLETSLEIIEAERIETPPSKREGYEVRQGVEIDATTGAPTNYWVLTEHPGDLSATRQKYTQMAARTRLGRRNIVHLYTKQRPGQTRGVPWMAPVMADLYALSKYEETEQIAARVAACFSVAITRDNADLALRTKEVDERGKSRDYLEPGLVSYLKPGESVSAINPTRPSSTFGEYVTHRLRRIGSAVGLPLELVLLDFSRTNYSSARASLLESRKIFRRLQSTVVALLCQPTWEAVIEEAVLRGKLSAPRGFWDDPAAWCRATWTPPAQGWIDPEAEVASSTAAMAGNLTTLAEECAAQGRDWVDVLRQRSREKAAIARMGLEAEDDLGVQGMPDMETETE